MPVSIALYITGPGSGHKNNPRVCNLNTWDSIPCLLFETYKWNLPFGLLRRRFDNKIFGHIFNETYKILIGSFLMHKRSRLLGNATSTIPRLVMEVDRGGIRSANGVLDFHFLQIYQFRISDSLS